LGYTLIDNVTVRAPLIDRADQSAGPASAVVASSGHPQPTIREIFDEHASFVWRTLRHLGVHDADIEDVCQEVFVTVHRKLAGFEWRSTLRTWLYGICLRVASDYRRRAHVRRELPVAEPAAGAQAATQLEDLARVQARKQLLAILERLDADKRAVFVLYELEELGMKEVSEIVGCPLQTAYSRLHAARKVVLEAIRRLQPGGEP